jgi:hypothetical protein
MLLDAAGDHVDAFEQMMERAYDKLKKGGP